MMKEESVLSNNEYWAKTQIYAKWAWQFQISANAGKNIIAKELALTRPLGVSLKFYWDEHVLIQSQPVPFQILM